MFCKNCGSPLPMGARYCNNCGVCTGNGRNFCPNCGRSVSPGDLNCPACGMNLSGMGGVSPIPGNTPYYATTPFRSRIVAGILALFFGTLGVHNFYLGYTNKAIAQLLLTTVGGLVTCGISVFAVAVWSFVEAIMIFIGSIDVDGRGYPLRD